MKGGADEVWRGRRCCLTSLRQSQEDVFNQHGADHHLLAVDRQLSGALLSGCHGDQHQAAAGDGPASKPVDRMSRRRNRRTEVKAAKIRSKVGAIRRHTSRSGSTMSKHKSYKVKLILFRKTCTSLLSGPKFSSENIV